ncbi:MAG: hypothetical protein MUF10_11100 [Thermoanaerobaculaceae bacterium]|nr:hypothetical protein [Thermoanaerobaculaceae bacterium]
MILLLTGLGVLLATGLVALPWRDGLRAGRVAAAGSVLGCGLVTVPAVRALVGWDTPALDLPWPVPLGSFSLGIDALSGFFVLVVALLGALAAVYGVGYLAHAAGHRRLGVPWCLYNLLLACMLVVVTARDGVLFLVAWEVMSLASFFLVTFEDEREEVREAGWTYLLATHLGTAFLLALFLVLAQGGSLRFDTFRELPSPLASVAFLLAVVGFGTKAGFWPLHVWLPEAHPAAPSHVSAVMSGVMLKTGIYGLLRVLTVLGPPPRWWGWLLVGIGVTSGLLGVLSALAQRDLKRILAYSSVENIGLVALGAGLGVLGLAFDLPVMAALGFAGALLHVLNHAVFKGLLFLGAGAVLHATGTRDIERLGGLLRRVPSTAHAFLVGSAAISGLPPFNGFVSELLILLAALAGVSERAGGVAVPATIAVAALGLVGGLAAACFARAFGVVFLGVPRQGLDREPAEATPAGMRLAMATLAGLCVAIGLGSSYLVPRLVPAVGELTGLTREELLTVLGWDVGRILLAVGLVGAAFGLVALLLARLRARMLRMREVGSSPTWDCGYAAPTARMQYTASSFARPIVELFSLVLHTRIDEVRPVGMLPSGARLQTRAPDVAEAHGFRPAFVAVARLSERLHVLQQGRVQVYVLYIALALLVLLVWQLGLGR